MKNKSKNLMVLSICLIICTFKIGYYYIHPKTILLNSILFANYSKGEIKKIEIRSTYSREDKLEKP